MKLSLIANSPDMETMIATSMLTTTSGAMPSTLYDRLKAKPEKVADIVGEIALASKEQAQGVEQINTGLEQIDQVTQANTAAAEESASAAEELASQAQQLKGLLSRFTFDQSRLGLNSRTGRERTAEDLEPVEQAEGGNPRRRAAVTVEASGSGKRKREGNGHGHAGEDLRERDERKETPNPKEVIKLDDEDFGDF